MVSYHNFLINALLINKEAAKPIDSPETKVNLPPEDPGTPPAEPPGTMSSLSRRQLLIFSAMFVGYGSYTFNRKSVALALPTLMRQGLTKDQAGLITSCQNAAYAVSKFLSGILADNTSSKLLFSSGLVASGATAVIFSGLSSVPLQATLWFINGVAQGAGWPACAKIIRQWYPKCQFGRWWSTLSTSANLSLGVAPIIAAYIIVHHGWRSSVFLTGGWSIIVGAAAYFLIIDSPADIGLQSYQQLEETPTRGSSGCETTWRDLVRNKFLWLISLCYMSVFCVKTACVDWGQLYLMEERFRTQYTASAFISAFEFGGLIGVLLAGYVSDWLTSKQTIGLVSGKHKGNARVPVTIVLALCSAFWLHAFRKWVDNDTDDMYIIAIGAMLGVCLYGCIAIFGVVACESAPIHLTCTAHAIAACAGNCGAVIAGLPFSYVAEYYQWSAVIFILEVMAGVTSVVLVLVQQVANSTRCN